MGSARAQAVANENRSIEESQSRALAARQEQQQRPRNALEAMADRLKINATALQNTLRATVFRECKKDEEFFALVVVANEYGLNPLLKEIYAFPGKGGGIVPMVSIDGWIRIMNEHPQFDGIDFDFIHTEKGEIDAVEAIIHRKDRAHPVKVIEFLDENKRPTEPWKQMPRRMLRHRALIQCARIAFGFSGIVSEGDEDTIIDVTPRPAQRLPQTRTMGEELDDEIPAFDSETGEVHDDQPRDSRGMTEVDEEVARQLDDEADDEPGYEEGAEESPSDAKLREIRERIEAADSKAALKKVDDDWVKARAAYDDETAGEVDAAITAKRNSLSEGEGGK